MSSATSSPPDKLTVYLNQALVLLIAAIGFVGLYSLRDPAKLTALGWSGLLTMGVVGLWRWSWFGVNILRWLIYQHGVFPRWRRRANAMPIADLPPVCLLVPTYKEKDWITERVFRSIALEAKTLDQPVIIMTVSSGAEEDAAIVAALRLGDPELSSVRVFHAKDPGDGKRKALAEGLRAIARLNLPSNTIIALMDGDSEFSPGTLRKTLPFFNLFPKLGALTTDEVPVVMGSYWFSEWFHLRFAQRHYQMCSISLSKKLLCLTGRFSLYRSEACLHPDFATQLESDMLDDWLWGQFKFLSGDDKTTWYWMLRHGNYDLLYIPDVVVYSIETVSGSVPNRMYQNMRRWFGNMLRNGNRAMALGPRKLGLFVLICLIDQRLSMWTSLLSPCLLLIALFKGHWIVVGLLLSWLVMSRSLTLSLIFWGRESYLKPEHLPILLLSQWSSGLIKIWTQMNLAQQRWFNRGDRKLAASGNRFAQEVARTTSRFLLWAQAFTFGIIIFSLLGNLSPLEDAAALWKIYQAAPVPTTIGIVAMDWGVIPGDGQDDGAALQRLIDGATLAVSAKQREPGVIQINLPIGELDLDQPLVISRSQTRLVGQGADRTIFTVHFAEDAVIAIHPKDSSSVLENVHLQGFTLRSQASQTSESIVLKDVHQSSLKNIHLAQGSERGVALQNTQDVVMEYVTTENYAASAVEEFPVSVLGSE
jgi:mannuronan synthase